MVRYTDLIISWVGSITGLVTIIAMRLGHNLNNQLSIGATYQYSLPVFTKFKYLCVCVHICVCVCVCVCVLKVGIEISSVCFPILRVPMIPKTYSEDKWEALPVERSISGKNESKIRRKLP